MYIHGGTTVSLIANQINCNTNGGGVGGGCYVYGGTTVSFTENVFQFNRGGYGGGIAVSGAATVTLVDNLLKQNNAPYSDGSSSGFGGGIYIVGDTVSISGNDLLQNTAGSTCKGFGGGIYVSQSAGDVVTCSDNVFVGNAVSNSGGQGGGFYCDLSGNSNTCLRFVNNTVYANANAQGKGGGVYFGIGSSVEHLYVYNNTIWGNTAADGEDIYLTGYGSEKKLYNNNYHGMSGLWDFAVSNIDVNPLFVDTPNGDYRLRANSFCINAGNNNAPGLSLVDSDGNVRVGDGVVDIGAYEQCWTDRHPADTNANWVIEANEFNAYAAAWTNRAAWPSGPNPVPMDYVTRAGYLLEDGATYHNEGGGKPRNWKPGP